MSIYNLNQSLVAWIDLTTYCNAGCPQCHRTDPNGLGKIDWLPLIKWDLAQFKKAYPPRTLRMIKRFEICGTWGDPIMVKDIYEICEYIIENSRAWIQINTNGGFRDDDFWWKLGILSRNRMQVIFDIEGINQEMHSHYRRKVDFEKLKLNIQSYTAAGGNAFAHVIVFKHNEDYIEDILEMCYNELGMTDHLVQPSNRFNKNPIEEYTDEDGIKFKLEESSLPLDDPRFKLPAPHRDHKWWQEKGNRLVYNKDTSNEKSNTERNF
jgi:molybdenum cofactor biosynthesis enzyme MoaA